MKITLDHDIPRGWTFSLYHWKTNGGWSATMMRATYNKETVVLKARGATAEEAMGRLNAEIVRRTQEINEG